jgi:hypothetical protein
MASGSAGIGRKLGSFLQGFLQSGLWQRKKARRDNELRRALQCRGGRIRTSDLLNPIQGPAQPNPLPGKGDAPSPPSACTNACTGEAGNANAGTVESLAAALLALSPADRARLAALLLGQQAGRGDVKP